MEVLFYIIFLLNVILVLLKKNSRVLNTLSFLLIVFISYKNSGSGDYQSYKLIYDGVENYGEAGFVLLINICKFFGFDFNVFQCILCVASVSIILWVFSKYSKNYALFFTLIFITELFVNINVLRSFFARALLVLAVHHLIKGRKIMFLLVLTLATTFHITMIMYFPLILFNPYKKLTIKQMKILISIVVIACIGFFLMGNDFTWLYKMISGIIPSLQGKIDVYFTEYTRFGFLIYFVLHIGNVLLCLLGKKKMNDKALFKTPQQNLYQMVFVLNFYTIFFFPLLMMSTSFCRVLNNIFFFNVMYYATLLDQFRTRTTRYYKILFAIIGIQLLSTLPFVHASNQRTQILSSLNKK